MPAPVTSSIAENKMMPAIVGSMGSDRLLNALVVTGAKVIRIGNGDQGPELGPRLVAGGGEDDDAADHREGDRQEQSHARRGVQHRVESVEGVPPQVEQAVDQERRRTDPGGQVAQRGGEPATEDPHGRCHRQPAAGVGWRAARRWPSAP